MSKLYSVAGVSIHKGTVKVRFCSDLVLRVKNLIKQGDESIDLIELPHPMTKFDACQYLIDCGRFSHFSTEITEIQGKKEAKAVKVKIEAPVEIIDSDINNIKELAAA